MGSFSFTRAECTTKRANFTTGDKYKILIPKKFGGGFILDTYFDYGDINNYRNAVYVDTENVKHPLTIGADLYGVLAYFNDCDDLLFDGETKPNTILDILYNGRTGYQDNRCAGIDLDKETIKYPLKLVSANYTKLYEECPGRSYSDPNQGFCKGNWDWSDYQTFKDKIIDAEKTDNLTLDELLEAGYSLKEISSKYKNKENER